ncbi:hypothetical protein Ctha_2676 [Chloroherpeton thalassium ATCC 35110]|uniref:Uncharacterized protein n=1 Tax=Chloroherpeton thalassium (strain ATCC 35110 / GB-78) TaxID=517418 RepID=B3QYQ2_CHLT3|nr:hypothetical protein [Chloroherpeton thalassium]ACF15125.1 hypothetical protein Ctha_2676 [Chloroherpeton thalassium ATCC 35110]
MMAKNPVTFALWGMLVGNIEEMGLLPALQAGRAIAGSLEGDTILEKLAQLDGEKNYEVFDDNNKYTFVVIKKCPFSEVYQGIPEWGEHATNLVNAYNQREDGGGALHPLCLVHKGVRSALNAGIVSIGCRSASTGRTELAQMAMEETGISEESAKMLLDGCACLYAIKK